MANLLRWLSIHTRFTITIAVVYLVANILMHDLVQAIAKWIQDALTTQRTNLLVTVMACVTLALAVALIPRKLANASGGRIILFYCGATAALVAITYTTLFMVNTESIHFPQYAILAMIVFPLAPRFGETVLLVTLMGAIDEAHQYWVLNRHVEHYMDFNDIILNLEGAAIGVLLLAVLAPAKPTNHSASTYSLSTFLKSPAVLVTGVVAAVAALLAITGCIGLYNESGAWIVLRKIGPPTEFWMHTYWNKTCHVLMPIEGVGALALLTAFYVSLDFRLQLRFTDP